MAKDARTGTRSGLSTTRTGAPEPAGAKRGVVLVTTGRAAGRVVAVPDGRTVTFGRSDGCTVVLPDTGISRVHAEIVARGGEYVVRDRGSTNGTFVNEERIPFARALAHGDGLRLGAGTRLRFTVVDEVEARDLVRRQEALAREADRVREAVPGGPDEDPTVGAAAVWSVVRDPAMQALYQQAARAARTQISVLVLGETGVGKEVLAMAIHRASLRAHKPFLALNVAALPETLLEAELFGHEKNAFTGAGEARPGLFEAAEGGTVFLDEVGDLAPSVQVKLLRVLEERQVMRLGARVPHKVDVRFVAATNRDLEAEVADGTFRRDLFFRLCGVTLTIPPLRQRPGDIEELAALFLARACAEGGRAEPLRLSDEARRVLVRYAWPGNVRELRNVIEQAAALSTGPTLLPEHLPPRVLPGAEDGAVGAGPDAEAMRAARSAGEKRRVLDVLARCGGNQTRAAVELGVSRRTLVSRLQEWGMTRPRQSRRGEDS